MRKSLIIPLLFFATFLVGVYLVFPKFSLFSNLRKELLIKEADLQKKQAYFLSLQEISADLKSYQDSLAIIDQALPEEPSIASLMYYFQTEAIKSGLMPESIGLAGEVAGLESSPEVRKQLQLREISFSLKVTGSLAHLEGFLKKLEKSARLIEVTNLNLGGEESEEKLPGLEMVVKVYSY